MDTTVMTTQKDSAESRRKMLLALGKRIEELQEYVKPRHNVHQEIKRLAASIRRLYDDYADQAEESAKKPKSTAVHTQTSPGPRMNRARDHPEKPKPSDFPKMANTMKSARQEQRTTVPPSAVPQASTSSAAADGTPVSPMDWQKVGKRRTRAAKRRPVRPDLIILRVKEGGPSYAEMLRSMKEDPSLKTVGDNVTKVRRNAAGNLLLELKKSAAANQMSVALSQKLGDSASVVTRTQETTLEIRDLDESTTTADVRAALEARLEMNIDEAVIKSIRKAYGSTQTAVLRLPMEVARKLSETGKLRVGWVNCRIREKTEVRKCYRCWAFGHLARDCTGTDRTKCCLRCGEGGHKRATCKSAEARCVVCSDNAKRNHPTGSFGCPAYQAAVNVVAARS